MNWTELEIFKGIDLNDSFVLGWVHENDKLLFELEASIWPESKYYTKPNKNEYTCYRKATLKIVGAKKISGLKSMESARSTTDPDGSTDYENIDTLVKLEGGFELSGDFGSLNITGGVLSIEVHT